MYAALLAGLAGSGGVTCAGAQDAAIDLSAVNVSATRLLTAKPKAPARERDAAPPPRARTITAAPTSREPSRPVAAAPQPVVSSTPATPSAPSGILTGTIITGASSTVITAADIERSPGLTLQDLLAREPGVQVTSLFGAVNGARSTVDLRGFGATASNNTLVLINGRRVNELDLEAVDLSTIPRESIERIEITRGNSGTVLYGDGAVGGVINIVTKTGVAAAPFARVQGSTGSFGSREAVVSAGGSAGPFAAAVFASNFSSNGYRANNRYRQESVVGDFRYTTDIGSYYLNVAGDVQHLGLPGARLVQASTGINQLITDPTGATTPYDDTRTHRSSVTTGFTWMLAPGAELIVDGGMRQKEQRAFFFGSFLDPASPDPKSYFEATLGTSSVTPRLKIDSGLFGLPTRALGGVDFYRTGYDSPRSMFREAAPIHRYDLSQMSLAAYWQQTVTLPTNTDVAAGYRWQRTSIKASDQLDLNAPGAFPLFCDPVFGCFGDTQGIPLNRHEDNRAYHLGFEHRFNAVLSVFGRHASSFRVPNVDERVGMVTAQNGIPTTFDLRTQRSKDFEGGVRVKAGPLDAQWSIYDMHLVDEIYFHYAPGFIVSNTNLDPTRRYGNETIVNLRLSDAVRLKGGFAYTRAIFVAGMFAGHDVPLVSRRTGSFGVTWDIWQRYLTVDGTIRYIGERRMDNDQFGLQPVIPAHTLVDVRVGGQYGALFWSLAVQNLFNQFYFDYAIASPFPFGPGSEIGKYNAYPQPQRTFVLKAGASF
jgi:iron complex outermembrane receptor protein